MDKGLRLVFRIDGGEAQAVLVDNSGLTYGPKDMFLAEGKFWVATDYVCTYKESFEPDVLQSFLGEKSCDPL